MYTDSMHTVYNICLNKPYFRSIYCLYLKYFFRINDFAKGLSEIVYNTTINCPQNNSKFLSLSSTLKFVTCLELCSKMRYRACPNITL